jgi:D-alanyl-D-alanine carboxypeptidase (penicillin-binding protein 5/6)
MRALGKAAAAGIMAGLLAAGLAVAAPGAGAAVAAPGAVAASGPAGVQAPYADLADAGTGADLWNQDPTAEVPMGSIVKVMTAYVVIQAGNLDQLITVHSGITAYDKDYGASTAGLKPGEKLTARQLLYAMLIPSGCDAAYTLANAYGPGLPAFIAKMNAAAAQLGLTSTHFTDVSGLPIPTETSTYSDARDLVSLGRDAMALPLFASIAGLASYELPSESGLHPSFTWKTTNPLIGTYGGTTGIKTGDTQAAGSCLLFEATRGGKTLIGVVLNDPSFKIATSDAEQMMNWGWTNP